jgi:hypothetical protein
VRPGAAGVPSARFFADEWEVLMKRTFLLLVALLLSAEASATTEKWTAGWDNFSEPLNFTNSNITWSVSATTRKLTVTFKLVGATPSKLYQVGVHIFCTTFPKTFGQFPSGTGGACTAITRQGVTKTVTAVEFGVVTTDIHGNGSFTVVVGPIAAGTYHLEFDARNGAGCGLTGGGGNSVSTCEADFQSPGPTFGTAAVIIVP